MKIAVSGKGGTGKSTVSALMSLGIARKGKHVIAIDADSNANLSYYLGVENPEEIVPLCDMESLIAERTGAEKGKYGAYFKMNPRVDDIPDKYSIEINGIKLLTMGSVNMGGGGCACPEYILMKNLVAFVILNRDETLIMDMEAGLEHLGRGVTASMDVLTVVVNPDKVSVVTAVRVQKLAEDIGITKICAIGNRVRNDDDKEFIQSNVPFDVIAFIPFIDEFAGLVREGRNIFTEQSEPEVNNIIQALEKICTS